LARERLARQQSDASQALKERENAIDSMVQPIREALAKTEVQIQSIERDRIDSFATLKTQMEALALGQTSLSRETRNLVTALRRPNVRGQWGEITLRRLVELSGMTSNVDLQSSSNRAPTRAPFDPIWWCTCPSGANIVVDVKTPLDAYLAAVEAQDDEETRHAVAPPRANRRCAGSRAIPKQYWSQFERSPDSSSCSCRAISSVGGAAGKPAIIRGLPMRQ